MSINEMLMAAAGGGSAPEDPDFENVTLLLNGDGTNGAQNNTFVDSSTNNFSITRNGNTTQGSFSPYGNLWSVGGWGSSSSYLQMGSNAGLQLGTGDFTVECFAFFTTVGTASGGENVIMDVRPVNTTGAYFNFGLSNQKVYWDGGVYLESSTVAISTWHHIAIVRSSGSTSLYINGSRVAGPTSDSTNYTSGSTNRIGNLSYFTNGDRQFNGNISNLRILKGTALYTGATVTVPTTPLTAITNTTLLACQANRFIDSSSSAIPITLNGSAAVQRFSPFNPTAPYSTSVIGGSANFGVSGDYLSLPSNSAFAFGTGNFTVEAWIYPTIATSTYETIVDTRDADGSPTGWNLGFTSTPGAGNCFFYNAGFVLSGASGSVPFYAWTHVAVVRSGSTLTLYLNGVSVSTATTSSNFTDSTARIAAPAWSTSVYFFTGYLSNIREVKGTAVYTSNFTPSTAPLTAVSGTSLLTNFINAGIPDLAMQNNLQTVGNAQVSTSVKKYGTGSIAFDGSTDGLVLASNPPQVLRGNFTIEGWVYLNNTTGSQTIIGRWQPSNQEYLLWISSGTVQFYLRAFSESTPLVSSSSTVSATTWTYVAVVRNGSTFTIYINGTSAGTATNSSAMGVSTAATTVGSLLPGYSGYDLNGYIDDLRVTNGIARYTANFTAPASALPTF